MSESGLCFSGECAAAGGTVEVVGTVVAAIGPLPPVEAGGGAPSGLGPWNRDRNVGFLGGLSGGLGGASSLWLGGCTCVVST